MRVVTIANLKGGTTKTTVAAYLAHAWYERGEKVLLVDADPSGSALRWSELASWPLPAVGLSTRDVHKRLAGIADGYGMVVVDTPPFEEQQGIVFSAVRAADDVIVPVSPTTMELDRLSPIMTTVEDVEPLRHAPPRVSVVLSRVVTGASSGPATRDAITGAGYHVLRTEIPRREAFGQAFGAPVQVEATPFTVAADEIMERVAS